VGQIVAPQNPLLRKYNMADRERQFAEGTVTLQPVAKWSMTATGRYANASYINSRLGLLGSREEGATFGSNWAATEKLTLFADYGWQSINARQAGSAAYSVRDWSANSIDRFRSGSAGLRVVGLAKGVDLDVHGFFANSDGDTTLTTPSVDRLPTLRTRSNGGEVALSWRRSGPLSLRAALRYEHFDADELMEEMSRAAAGRRISRPTVYRTLRELVDAGLLRQVNLLHESVRLDANLDNHHHLVCVQCKSVTDIPEDAIAPVRMNGHAPGKFRIQRYNVEVLGLCARCASARHS